MLTIFVVFVPLTVLFSNLLLEGIERLWEIHEFLPNPKHFPLATEESVLHLRTVRFISSVNFR